MIFYSGDMKTTSLFLISLLLGTKPLFANTPPKAPRIEVCFVLDTTGSMSGLLQGAKEKIWSIVQEIKHAEPVPELKIGLIGYRDRGDASVTRMHPMTEDLDALFGELLQYKAHGGGDTPESVNQALSEALENIKWTKQEDVYRVIFLVGDAPPQTKYDEAQIPDICTLAKKKGILINTVQCGSIPDTRAFWKDIAKRTGGDYAAIQQNGGVQVIQTPYDEQIQRYNQAINQTVIVYGSSEDRRQGLSKVRIASEANTANVSRAAWNAKYNKGKAISGSEDLLAEIASDASYDYTSIQKEKLPEAFRNLSEEELKAEVAKRQKDREEATKKIRELVEKRDQFLRKELEKKRTSGEGLDAFDEQVRKSIRKQGAQKGIHYK